MERRISDSADSSSHIRRLNADIFNRAPVEDSDIRLENKGWMDTNHASMPDYINRLLVGPFSSRPDEYMKDVILSQIMESPDYARSLNDSWRESTAALEALSFPKFDTYGRACKKEISKSQVLVGAPLAHTPLTLGTHFSHADIPSGFERRDFSWVTEAGKFFKDVTKCKRAEKFSLPMFTSQGLLLKTSRDSKEWRIFSKALMTALAAKCKIKKHLDFVVDRFDKIFTDRGFDPVAKHFSLGIRRHHSNKGEAVQSRGFASTQGVELDGVSDAIQGRARGIFLPTELMKAYFKKFADGLKKALFTATACCSVDPKHIAVRLAAITEMMFKKNLFQSDGTGVCFYDLSGYDTNTHRGWNNVYMQFNRAVFDNFDSIEGDMFENSGLYFPSNPFTPDTMFMEINGRSTLSGQPDVTVKNNVVHLLAMSQAIAEIRENESPLDIFKKLINGSSDIMTGIHGDDTMLYFSDKVSDYEDYLDILDDMGLPAGFEDGPIYLKKTPYTVLTDKILIDDTFSNLHTIDAGRDFDKYISNAKSSGIPSTFIDANFGMLPIIGSLQRNRFGEQPTSNKAVAMVALQDTARLSGDIAPEATQNLWESLSDFDGQGQSWTQLLEGHNRDIYLDELIELAKGSISDVALARGILTRMFYSSFESIDDESLEAVYGSLFLSSSDLVASMNLNNKTLTELMAMAEQLQDYILDLDGDVQTWPKWLDPYLEGARELGKVTSDTIDQIRSNVDAEMQESDND